MSTGEKLTLWDASEPRRLLAPDGRPMFTECESGWIILQPMGTWPQWRELAWLILESGDPGE